jgi:hypothetical protein
MVEHRRETYPCLAHALVAAHASRTRAFASQYGALAATVSERGHDAAESVALQRELQRQLVAWETEDHEDELRDMVVLAGQELESTRRGLEHALEYVDVLEASERAEVEEVLRNSHRALGPLPRSWARRLGVSFARLERLRELHAPRIILGREAELTARKLKGWNRPPPPWDEVTWSEGCRHLLSHGTRLCIERDSLGRRGVDLGLGPSSWLDEVLEMGVEDEDRLTDVLGATHPPALEGIVPALAAYPFVPPGRMHAQGPSFTGVCDHGRAVGPIGWAAGDDLAQLAEAYAALARATPRERARLEGVADRLRALHRRDAAVLGCLEFLSDDSDGVRTWLVDPDDDSDGGN